MRITHIDVSRVHVSLAADSHRAPAATDGYVPTEELHRHILRVRTDGGLTGLGETWEATPDAAVHRAAEALIGADPPRLPPHRLPIPHDTDIVNARDHGAMVAVRPVGHNPAVLPGAATRPRRPPE